MVVKVVKAPGVCTPFDLGRRALDMVKRSYSQFCPVSRSLDATGGRWTLLVVRELVRGPRRYSDLSDALPGMATNLLATRPR